MTATPPSTAAPIEATLRQVRGQQTEADVRLLGRLTRPSWIPSRVGYDVAAALSQLADSPSNWATVELSPRSDQEPWLMTVTYRRAFKPQTIEVPGGGGPGSGAAEVMDLVFHPEHFDVGREWNGWDPDAADVGDS